jgi:hypothetical protein
MDCGNLGQVRDLGYSESCHFRPLYHMSIKETKWLAVIMDVHGRLAILYVV